MIENQLGWQPYKQQFLQHPLEHIANRAAELMAALYELPEYDRKDRRGGVLALVPDETCTTHAALCIGEVPESNPSKYLNYAIRKCQILRDHPKAKSSYTVRNETNGFFGGGIPIRNLWDKNLTFSPFWAKDQAKYVGRAYVSFSGLPELADEALVLVLAIDMGWISLPDVEMIIGISENPFFQPLYTATRKPGNTTTA